MGDGIPLRALGHDQAHGLRLADRRARPRVAGDHDAGGSVLRERLLGARRQAHAGECLLRGGELEAFDLGHRRGRERALCEDPDRGRQEGRREGDEHPRPRLALALHRGCRAHGRQGGLRGRGGQGRRRDITRRDRQWRRRRRERRRAAAAAVGACAGGAEATVELLVREPRACAGEQGAELGGIGGSQVGITRPSGRDDLVEHLGGAGDLGRDLGDVLVYVLEGDVDRQVATEGLLAGEHLEENQPRGIHIGARVGDASAHLLGGDIGHRAEEDLAR